MTREEILRGAGTAAPELMQKTASILAQLEMTAPAVAEEVSGEISATVDYVAEKLAASQGYGPVARWGAATGSVIAAGLLGTVANDLYDVAKRGLTKSRNFKAIMQANPDLKAFPDKARLERSFTALHRFAPELTSDPLVGGSLLKSVAEVPGNEAVAIKDIINSRKNLLDAKDKAFRMDGPALELQSKEDAARAHLEQKKYEYTKTRDLARDLASTEESLYRRERDAKMDAVTTADRKQRKAMDDAARKLQEARLKAEEARHKAERAARIEQAKRDTMAKAEVELEKLDLGKSPTPAGIQQARKNLQNRLGKIYS